MGGVFVTLRTFLAIELPVAVRQAIVREAQRVAHALAAHSDGLSWVRPDMLHVTVKFFGETPESQMDGIRQAVGRAVSTRPSFDIAIEGGGAFPDRRAPRVLWAGIGGDVDTLAALVECVGKSVVPLGFPQEGKPFHPHLTLARVRRAYRDVGSTLGVAGIFTTPVACGRVPVERVALFKSDRRPGGSVYTKLWDVALDTGAGMSCAPDDEREMRGSGGPVFGEPRNKKLLA